MMGRWNSDVIATEASGGLTGSWGPSVISNQSPRPGNCMPVYELATGCRTAPGRGVGSAGK